MNLIHRSASCTIQATVLTSSEPFTVEVAYASATQQTIIRVLVKSGATAEQAIISSGILQQFQDIDLTHNKIGIFGKICTLDKVLLHKDRVEIYRPLLANPKEVRRKRAEQEKLTGTKRSKKADQLKGQSKRKATKHA